jgi:SAM-dependent methyltransferase
MSTERTGAAQLARLAELELQVRLLPPLRDVDLPADAEAVARRHPWLEFSREHRSLVDARPQLAPDRIFDRVFSGADTVVSVGAASLDLDVRRWSGEADPVDLMVVARCEPPVVDLGCGPGRMLVALNRSGRPALGIDMSEVAVAATRRRGGLALHRRLAERLPAEGRWGTALLVDSNVGIGGDIEALLLRCCQLIGPGGLVICEVDPSPDRYEVHEVVLTVEGAAPASLPWSRIGARALARFAARLDLLVVEEWAAGGRVFVSLRLSA